MAKLRIMFLLALMLGLLATAVDAQDSPRRVHYDQLLSQLRSDRSDEREGAAEAILEIGDDIRPWILRGAQSTSLEVRLRCQQLLLRIDGNSYSRRVAKFRESGDEKIAVGLPCWSEFRNLFGSDAKSRDLYCDMALSERQLLGQLAEFKETTRNLGREHSSSLNPAQLALRARPLQSSLELVSVDLVSGRPALSAESLCTCVLIVCEPDLANHRAISNAVFGYFRTAENLATLKKSRHLEAAQVGITRWLSESQVKVFPIDIAIRLGLSDLALAFGRSAVAHYTKIDSEFADERSQAAILGIIACGKFGDESDIERLAPLLSKQIVVQTWLTVDQKVATGQLRDLALVYSAHLAGVDAKILGFSHLETRPDTIYVPYTVTFVEDEQREAAHNEWVKLRAKMDKKSPNVPRVNAG